mmetsp:Transcript_5109/g.5233  ORF Transcript_5109/g.5233 Transcript_5109/m.5233 type:complete len:87 (-) Transcript_5109:419-679(-)
MTSAVEKGSDLPAELGCGRKGSKELEPIGEVNEKGSNGSVEDATVCGTVFIKLEGVVGKVLSETTSIAIVGCVDSGLGISNRVEET